MNFWLLRLRIKRKVKKFQEKQMIKKLNKLWSKLIELMLMSVKDLRKHGTCITTVNPEKYFSL